MQRRFDLYPQTLRRPVLL